MTTTQNASQVLERHYLESRAKILELAATLDRIDRAKGSTGDDPRADLLREGIGLLLGSGDNRAEQVQQLFSRKYSQSWREEMGI